MKKLLQKILKFGIVGFFAFIIDYGLLVFFTECLSVNYLVSSAISFCISVLFNYILSVVWVFDVNRENGKLKNFIIFIILSVIGLLFNQFLMYFTTEILGLYYMLSKIFATFVVMIYNFITRKMILEKN